MKVSARQLAALGIVWAAAWGIGGEANTIIKGAQWPVFFGIGVILTVGWIAMVLRRGRVPRKGKGPVPPGTRPRP